MKLKFKILGMHCSSCAINIDGELEDIKGVTESKTNFAKSETEILFDEKLIKPDFIIKTIKKIGYEAKIKDK